MTHKYNDTYLNLATLNKYNSKKWIAFHVNLSIMIHDTTLNKYNSKMDGLPCIFFLFLFLFCGKLSSEGEIPK